VVEVEEKQFAKKYDKLNVKYMNWITVMVNINSILFSIVNFHQLGFRIKSISIFAVIMYVNVCWQVVGESNILANIVKKK